MRDLLGDDTDLSRRQLTRLVLIVAAVSAAGWIWTLARFGASPFLVGTAGLAYLLGARHAFDVDHVVAIDNAVRRMTLNGCYPFASGLFFALGHSAMIGAIAIAAVTLHMTNSDIASFQSLGGSLGPAVSVTFLLVMAVSNFTSLWQLFKGNPPEGGLLGRLLTPLTRYVSRSWHLAPLGLVFAFGFDAATEIALLGLSIPALGDGVRLDFILTLPLMFAAGMMLFDLLDSIIMVRAYRQAIATHTRRNRYQLVMTGLSALLALGLAAIQVTGLFGGEPGMLSRTGAQLMENSSASGLAIAATFVTIWLLARRTGQGTAPGLR